MKKDWHKQKTKVSTQSWDEKKYRRKKIEENKKVNRRNNEKRLTQTKDEGEHTIMRWKKIQNRKDRRKQNGEHAKIMKKKD